MTIEPHAAAAHDVTFHLTTGAQFTVTCTDLGLSVHEGQVEKVTWKGPSAGRENRLLYVNPSQVAAITATDATIG